MRCSLFPAPLVLTLTACAPGLASAPRVSRHVAILSDRSPSIEDGHGSGCRGLMWMVERAIELPDVGSHSRIQAFWTGNGVGNTIVAIATPLVLPPPLTPDERARQRRARLSAERPIQAACAADTTASQTSPVWLSIRDVVAQMRSWGCAADHACTLLVQSDLQETDTDGIRRALHGAVHPTLPTPLDLSGLDVHVCGLGASTEPLDDTVRTRTETVWGRILPGATFAPVCG